MTVAGLASIRSQTEKLHAVHGQLDNFQAELSRYLETLSSTTVTQIKPGADAPDDAGEFSPEFWEQLSKLLNDIDQGTPEN